MSSTLPDIKLLEISNNEKYDINKMNMNVNIVDRYYKDIKPDMDELLSDVDTYYSKIYTEDEFVEYMKDKMLDDIDKQYFDIYISNKEGEEPYKDRVKINDNTFIRVITKNVIQSNSLRYIYNYIENKSYLFKLLDGMYTLLHSNRVYRLLYLKKANIFVKVNTDDMKFIESKYYRNVVNKNELVEVENNINIDGMKRCGYFKRHITNDIFTKDIKFIVTSAPISRHTNSNLIFLYKDNNLFCYNYGKDKVEWVIDLKSKIINGVLFDSGVNNDFNYINFLYILTKTKVFIINLNGVIIRVYQMNNVLHNIKKCIIYTSYNVIEFIYEKESENTTFGKVTINNFRRNEERIDQYDDITTTNDYVLLDNNGVTSVNRWILNKNTNKLFELDIRDNVLKIINGIYEEVFNGSDKYIISPYREIAVNKIRIHYSNLSYIVYNNINNIKILTNNPESERTIDLIKTVSFENTSFNKDGKFIYVTVITDGIKKYLVFINDKCIIRVNRDDTNEVKVLYDNNEQSDYIYGAYQINTRDILILFKNNAITLSALSDKMYKFL